MDNIWEQRPGDKSAPAGTGLLQKSLDVFEAISEDPEGLDHATLMVRTGISRPTLYRILASLSARGLIRSNPSSHTFSLGFRFMDMAMQAWASSDLAVVAAGELRRLRDITGETAYLGVMEGNHVLSIGRFQGAHTRRSAAQLGALKPLHCTSQGKSFLAHMSQARVDKLLDGPLERLTEHTLIDRALIDIELSKTRRRGYAIDDEEILLGTRCVGAPILDDNGAVVAAISVAGPKFRLSQERMEFLGREVSDAARQISSQLTPKIRRTGRSGIVASVSAYVGFHGINPTWDGPRDRLVWADRFGSVVNGYSLQNGSHELSGHGNRIDAISVARDGALSVFHPDGYSTQNGKLSYPLAQPVTAVHQDENGMIVAMRRGEAGSICRLHEGKLAEGIDLSGPITAIVSWDQALYLASASTGAIWKLDKGAGRARLLVNVPRAAGRPSGLAFDNDGALWVALDDGWSIARLNTEGELTKNVAIPCRSPTGIAFGAVGSNDIYVTTSRYELSRDELMNAPLSGHTLRIS